MSKRDPVYLNVKVGYGDRAWCGHPVEYVGGDFVSCAECVYDSLRGEWKRRGGAKG